MNRTLIVAIFWVVNMVIGVQAANTVTKQVGKNVKRDGAKESPGTDLYDTSSIVEAKSIVIRGILHSPAKLSFREFLPSELGNKGFDTKWLDVIVSAQVSKKDVQDGGGGEKVGVQVKIKKQNAALFYPYLELVQKGAF